MPAWMWITPAAGVLFALWMAGAGGWLAGWRYDWARARHLIQQTRAEAYRRPTVAEEIMADLRRGSMVWDEERALHKRRSVIEADLADIKWGPGTTATFLPAPPELAHDRLPDRETRELMLGALSPEALDSPAGMTKIAGYGGSPDQAAGHGSGLRLQNSGPGVEPSFSPGPDSSLFCEICPDAAAGYWATGHSAWKRCYRLGRCGLAPGPDQAPIRGIAQGRAGGCAPQESRPAARADLTGSLIPRPPMQDPGSLAHGGPGPNAITPEEARLWVAPSRLADTGDIFTAHLLADVAADMRRREDGCRLYSAAFALECARSHLELAAPLS